MAVSPPPSCQCIQTSCEACLRHLPHSLDSSCSWTHPSRCLIQRKRVEPMSTRCVRTLTAPVFYFLGPQHNTKLFHPRKAAGTLLALRLSCAGISGRWAGSTNQASSARPAALTWTSTNGATCRRPTTCTRASADTASTAGPSVRSCRMHAVAEGQRVRGAMAMAHQGLAVG